MVERLVANEKVEGSNPFARSKNMSDLSEKKCVACEGDIPAFDTKEIHKYLKKIDGWNVKNNEDKSFYLIKDFKFNNFKESQTFINKVGDIAEQENHHPDIEILYCKVTISLTTHDVGGLTDKDYKLAKLIDDLNI